MTPPRHLRSNPLGVRDPSAYVVRTVPLVAGDSCLESVITPRFG